MSILRIFFNNGSFFTFLALEILCLYLIVSFNEPQQAIAAETWSVRTGSVRDAWSGVQDYLDLEEANNDLKRENARLRAQLPSARYDANFRRDSTQDTVFRQRYTFLPANVVNRSQYGPNNTLVIDRGEALLASTGQGVVGPEGLLGIIDQTTENYARVISILHQATRISAGLRNNAYGTLIWDGLDPRYMTLIDVADYVNIPENDTVFTTGYSNVFPTGTVIGTVEERLVQPGTGSQNLRVKLIADPLRQRSGYVVQDIFKEEIIGLNKDSRR